MHLRATDAELERFTSLIRGMSRDSAVYRMLKAELSALGYWKNRARGKPNARNFGTKRAAISTLAASGHRVSADW